MENELLEFQAEIRRNANASAVASGDYTRDALLEELVPRLLRAEELTDYFPCYYEGIGAKSKSLQLDGYSDAELGLDSSLQLLILVQGEGHAADSLVSADITNAYKRAVGFFSDALSGHLSKVLEPSSPAHDLAALIYDAREVISTVRVYVLSDLPVAKSVKPAARENIGNIAMELHIWDLSRFFKLAAAGGHTPIDIDITTYAPEGIAALPASTGASDYDSYLCVVPGSFLADVYRDYGGRLLEGNVRAFLSARGNVNKGLRATIRSAPTRFFAYNNGITATATSASFDASGRLTRVVDLQIVNGGQTTASLYNTRERDGADLSAIYVQMKLSVVSPSLAQELMPLIARYANTQNKVNEADLFANHPFNQRVEELSRRIWTPKLGINEETHWFYERARAQYDAEQLKLTPAKRKQFLLQNPKSQVITKTDLAKVENTWAKRPFDVSLGAQKNFARYAAEVVELWSKDQHRYNDAWFRHLVAKTIVFNYTEDIVSKAQWYGRAYRANIVTYTIAKLLHMLDNEKPGQSVNLPLIWKTQSVPKALALQLDTVGLHAQQALIAPPAQYKNVTEWGKRRACWDALVSMTVPFVDDIESALCATSRLDEELKDNQKHSKFEATIDAVVQVIELAQSGFWIRACDSPDAPLELSYSEMRLLEAAAHGGAGWIPNDRDAAKLIKIKGKLSAAGFE